MFKSIPVILVVALCSLGCESTQKQEKASAVSPGMVNDTCPISSRPLTANSPTSTWDGVTLGFCCAGCKTRFDDQTPAAKTTEVDNLKAGKSTVVTHGMVNNVCPMSSRKVSAESPTSTWDGVTLGFCCNGCKTRFDDMTAAQKNAEIAKVTNAT